MLNFSTETMAPLGRAKEYSNILSGYLTGLEGAGRVFADVQEGHLLEARSVGFRVGALSGSVHRCNSLRHRYAIHQSLTERGCRVHLLKEGALTLVTDENAHHLKPGDLAFYRPKKTAEFHAPEGGSKTITFHIPWRLANLLSSGREIAYDRVFSSCSGIGACVASLMETIAERHEELTLADCAAMQTVLAQSIIQLGTSPCEEPTSLRHELLQSLKAIACASLDDPELTPAKVAEQAGISVRTLHRSFQASGVTFWSWVRNERLDRCHIEVTDPSFPRRSITEVAFRWGFNELSTFDRGFRKRYGQSPRAARSAGR